MTLFDGMPLRVVPAKVILSASRMTDLPRYYPEQLIAATEKRLPKGVHTLVVWTKHPSALLQEPLYSYLAQLKQQGIQLYIQLTITGMGSLPTGIKADGTVLFLEPNVPPYQDALSVLPKVIELVGKPERVRLRIDPLVRLRDAAGAIFSNMPLFPSILTAAARLGVTHCSVSFLENVYAKVQRRFQHTGCTILAFAPAERQAIIEELQQLAGQLGVGIFACCIPGLPDSACIDGPLLQQLHDTQAPVTARQPRSRPQCGCTESIDIGGWPPKPCFSGCDYCYARPVYGK